MNRPWMISRRALLRSAGTAIALPVLDAMFPSIARAGAKGAPPRRLLAWFVPNGIHMAAFTPAEAGENYALTPILESLAPVKNELLVLTGLANRPSTPETSGDHATGTAGFLTASRITKSEGADVRNNISMDQVAANAIGANTLFPSLQLGAEGGDGVSACDAGYSCAYTRNISWAGPTTPLAKEVNPQGLFDRLFRGLSEESSQAEAARRKQDHLSVLDFVKDDAARLNAKLGRRDRRKLDEYLTGIRELEKRLEASGRIACVPGARPGAGDDLQTRIRSMSDLMVLALQCDMTRVITFMLANGISNRAYGFLDINQGHHQISHHQNRPENLRQLQAIDTWEVEQLSYLLQRMKAIEEPDGTLLDNSLVFFSSEIEDGDRHSHTNLPVLVAGKGGGRLRTGRHIRYEQELPIANLFISMLSTVGVNLATFGDDGTGPLPDLT